MNGNQHMTRKILNIYKTFDVVVVPFPFVDQFKSKNRPAIILSSGKYFDRFSNHSIATMITSARHSQWPLDIELFDLKACGLLKPSLIRFKLFTLDHRLIKQKIGHLSDLDQENLAKNFKLSFSDLLKD